MARYKVGDKVRLIDNFVQYEEYYMRDRNNNPGSIGADLTALLYLILTAMWLRL